VEKLLKLTTIAGSGVIRALEPDGAGRQGPGDGAQPVIDEHRRNVVLGDQRLDDLRGQGLGVCLRQPHQVRAAVGGDDHVGFGRVAQERAAVAGVETALQVDIEAIGIIKFQPQRL